MVKRMIFKLFCILIQTITSFKIIPDYKLQHPRKLSICSSIHPLINDTVHEISERYPNMVELGGYDGIICNTDNDIHYGQTIYYANQTDIHIKTILVLYHNTLYNVLLHEFGHSLGLKHSTKRGIMNYSIRKSRLGIKNDDRKLWWSRDDIRGLRFIRNTN